MLYSCCVSSIAVVSLFRAASMPSGTCCLSTSYLPVANESIHLLQERVVRREPTKSEQHRESDLAFPLGTKEPCQASRHPELQSRDIT
jgi:hypothetical protein